jgi:hypothetical protein
VSVILNQAGSGELTAFVQPREPDAGASGGSRPFRAISVSLENLINGEKALGGEIDRAPGSGEGSDCKCSCRVCAVDAVCVPFGIVLGLSSLSADELGNH